MSLNASKSREQIAAELSELRNEYDSLKQAGLKLDLSRGKPCTEQLDLANEMFSNLDDYDFRDSGGFDTRNYGELSGIPDMKKLYAEILGVKPENVIIGGNSSLNLMFDTFVRAFMQGMVHSEKPWSQCGKVKFIAPVPGYDRHFAVAEHFGIELIPVPLTDDGPDMDLVESLVAEDASVKGMLCIPVYSNPEGVVFSAETVRRLASMKCAAPDFTIIWDNAYGVHHLYEDYRPDLPNILEECVKYGNDSRVLMFASTSKITIAGGGVSCIAANTENINEILHTLSVATISYDKVNQLRHARYLKSAENVDKIMMRHAAIIRPKFEATLDAFRNNLSDIEGVHWTNPKGGYFISLYVVPGTAKRVHELCKNAGVTLTPAGAPFPKGYDPQDSNLRIAPTYAEMDELHLACRLLCLCIRIAAYEKILAK